MNQPPYTLIVSMDVAPEAEDLFNEVYDGEHIPALLKVPGVRSAARMEAIPATFAMAGALQELPAASPAYIAVYGIDDPSVLASPEWAHAVEQGRWPTLVRPHTSNRRHALYKTRRGRGMDLGQSIDERLVVYGTLAPGQVNHHEIADAGGVWLNGTVRGRLRMGGWGSALGFPGLDPDPGAAPVPVKLLVSAQLPQHLARLDEFEGAAYQRVRIPVSVGEATTEAWVYALAPEGPSPAA